MDEPFGRHHIYKTGAVNIRGKVVGGLEDILSKYVVKKDRHVNPRHIDPAEDEIDEYDRVQGVSIDLSHRVVTFYGGEYEDKWENSYGLSGKTNGERLFDAMDIIINRWCPKKDIVAGYDDDDESGIIFDN